MLSDQIKPFITYSLYYAEEYASRVGGAHLRVNAPWLRSYFRNVAAMASLWQQ